MDWRYFAFRGTFSQIRISDFSDGNKFARISFFNVRYLYISTRKIIFSCLVYFYHVLLFNLHLPTGVFDYNSSAAVRCDLVCHLD